MQAVLRSFALDPEPISLPADVAEFRMNARLIVGPADGPGEESFDVTVCSPQWLGQACRVSGGIYDARHHVVVDVGRFDQRALKEWFAARVRRLEGGDWGQIAERLGRLGYWEFED